MIELLIGFGVKLSFSSLSEAVSFGNLNLIRYICDKLDLSYLYGQMMCLSAEKSKLEVLKFFELKLNGHRKKKNSHFFETCVEISVKKGNMTILKYLIEELRIPNRNIGKLISFACKSGKFEPFIYLIEREKITMNDLKSIEENNFLLHGACSESSLEIVRYLIQIGKLDINRRERLYDRTPVFECCSSGKSLEILKFLVENGANLALYENMHNDTPLLILCSEGKNLEMIQVLIQHSVDINQCDIYGRSPLAIAELNEFHEISNLLRENNAKYICPKDWKNKVHQRN